MGINLTALIRAGRQVGRDEHKSQEAGKIGTLRAGSSGIMSDTGDVTASCHRKTFLRTQGIEIDPPDEKKLIMFELGYASEDITAGLIEKSLPAGQVMLREADIPIAWTTSNGTPVTGRPDLVICDLGIPSQRPDDYGMSIPVHIPVLGIELKSVHSVWTVREVLFAQTPKLANIAQAAHYMWKLGIPYKLVYKSYSQLGQGMSWAPRMAAMFPVQGAAGSEYMTYNEKGIPKEVAQFEIVYDLDIDSHGRVRYRLEENPIGKWYPSLVTVQDIERYYEYVSTMQTEKKLGPRPMTLDAVGGKENYSMCDFCPIQNVCDATEAKGFDRWFSEVQKATAVVPSNT